MAITVHEIGEATVVVPGDHVGVVEVEDCLLLVDEGAGRGYPLNITGSLVWQLLGSSAPLGELIEDLSAVFGAPRPDVAHDVIGLVRTFGSLGLLDGVFRSLESVPIDIEFVDADDCDAPDAPDARLDGPGLDTRYLAAPPNA
ncbi:MAG: PqqD family protein [Acidimicrobiales bacterium]